ncbi:MAG: sugar phosphate nucleotidyltransferase [Chlamydiae bacterium]|nr:sugar phosphate nucleotidyltransferase [Chlamydiota bacterium]
MDAVILAGGLGTRLRSVVADSPKALALINGHVFLEYLLEQLAEISDIQSVTLAIGYKADAVKEQYADHSYPFDIVFSEEQSPLGTGGALKKSLSYTKSDQILVLNGDSYLEFSFEKLLETFKKNKADAVIVTTHVTNANRFGLIKETDGRIEQFLEKSLEMLPGKVNGGIYLIKRFLLEELSLEGAFSLEKEVFPLWMQKRLFISPTSGLFIDIGTPESFALAQTLLRDKL